MELYSALLRLQQNPQAPKNLKVKTVSAQNIVVQYQGKEYQIPGDQLPEFGNLKSGDQIPLQTFKRQLSGSLSDLRPFTGQDSGSPLQEGSPSSPASKVQNFPFVQAKIAHLIDKVLQKPDLPLEIKAPLKDLQGNLQKIPLQNLAPEKVSAPLRALLKLPLVGPKGEAVPPTNPLITSLQQRVAPQQGNSNPPLLQLQNELLQFLDENPQKLLQNLPQKLANTLPLPQQSAGALLENLGLENLAQLPSRELNTPNAPAVFALPESLSFPQLQKVLQAHGFEVKEVVPNAVYQLTTAPSINEDGKDTIEPQAPIPQESAKQVPAETPPKVVFEMRPFTQKGHHFLFLRTLSENPEINQSLSQNNQPWSPSLNQQLVFQPGENPLPKNIPALLQNLQANQQLTTPLPPEKVLDFQIEIELLKNLELTPNDFGKNTPLTLSSLSSQAEGDLLPALLTRHLNLEHFFEGKTLQNVQEKIPAHILLKPETLLQNLDQKLQGDFTERLVLDHWQDTLHPELGETLYWRDKNQLNKGKLSIQHQKGQGKQGLNFTLKTTPAQFGEVQLQGHLSDTKHFDSKIEVSSTEFILPLQNQREFLAKELAGIEWMLRDLFIFAPQNTSKAPLQNTSGLDIKA